jgi:hypothetical protein
MRVIAREFGQQLSVRCGFFLACRQFPANFGERAHYGRIRHQLEILNTLFAALHAVEMHKPLNEEGRLPTRYW